MFDPIVVVRFGDGDEAKTLVERLEVPLRVEPDRDLPEPVANDADRLGHQRPRQTLAACGAMNDDPANRRFLVEDAGAEQTGVRSKAHVVMTEDVQRLRIATIGVEVRARLLDDEDGLSKRDSLVESAAIELVEGRDRPAEAAQRADYFFSVFFGSIRRTWLPIMSTK